MQTRFDEFVKAKPGLLNRAVTYKYMHLIWTGIVCEASFRGFGP